MFIKSENKKSFLLIELIFVIIIISIVSYTLIPKPVDVKLDTITKRLTLYLNHTRYKSFIDDKYSLNEELWHKRRWTLKFFRCRESVGGIYYVIYSDKNMSGHPGKDDSLKDPLTKKYIYSSNKCEETKDNSKYVLLTKNFDIENIELSCNNTSSLGQISFGNNGKIYSKLSNNVGEESFYEIKEPCFLKLVNNKNLTRTIKIHGNTGFIEDN